MCRADVAEVLQFSDAELHLICLEHFERDWRRFADRFASDLAGHDRAVPKKTNNGSRATYKTGYGITLNQEQKVYVRDVMFPDDTTLWRRVCNSSR